MTGKMMNEMKTEGERDRDEMRRWRGSKWTKHEGMTDRDELQQKAFRFTIFKSFNCCLSATMTLEDTTGHFVMEWGYGIYETENRKGHSW